MLKKHFWASRFHNFLEAEWAGGGGYAPDPPDPPAVAVQKN